MKIDNLADAIVKELQEYSQEVADITKDAVKETATETVSTLKRTSPKRTGRYAKSWRQRTTTENRANISITVYNGRYQLTHLLEKGHAKVNGGFVPGIPHIAPAEEQAERLLTEKIEKRI